MRAWLEQPHGRHHKAPPQPCALATTKKPGGWRIVASAAELETNFEFEDLSEGDESGDESDDESDDGNGDDEGGSSDDDDD